MRTTATHPGANPNTPPIPHPVTNLLSIATSVAALKAAVESLIGQRGPATNRAVTFNDLVEFGLLDKSAVSSPGGSAGPGTNQPITLTGDAIGTGTSLIPTTVTGLQGNPVAATAPTASEVLAWDGASWAPAPPVTGGGGGTGDIEGVVAGTGLAGGGTSGTVTVSLVTPVAVVNGGTGAATSAAALTNLGGAPLASPVFTGDPRAPTASPGDADTSIATTGFVAAAVTAAPNKTITLSGDTTGSGTSAITTTLATVNANTGTFQGITVNGKGQVTAAVNQSYLTAPVSVPNGGTGATSLPLQPAMGAGTVTGSMMLGTGTTPAVTSAYWSVWGDTGLTGYVASASAAAAPYLAIGRGLGTPGSPAAVTGGTELGTLYFDGYDGAGWNNGANIWTAALESWSGTARGAQLRFETRSVGSAGVNAQRMAVGPGVTIGAPTSGDMGAGTLNATGLYVNGVAAQTGNQTITLSGDIAGSGATAITTTLPNVNANTGTFQGITVNAKGQVTAAASQSYLTASGVSGMTAGQIPIAATATTITSSGNLSGAVTTSGSLATTLAANAVATTNITNANVTYAKIQNVAASRVLGNPTGSAAAPSEISLGTGLTFSGTVLNGAVGTLTGVTAGTGLTGGGTSGNPTVSLTVPVSVANGGTNATSAAAALTSLGAAPATQYASAAVASGAAFAITSAANTNVTSVSLVAGDWDVEGTIWVRLLGTSSVIEGWVNSTSAIAPALGIVGHFFHNWPETFLSGFPTGKRRFNLGATTTVYLSVNATFTSTATVYGEIVARRVG